MIIGDYNQHQYSQGEAVFAQTRRALSTVAGVDLSNDNAVRCGTNSRRAAGTEEYLSYIRRPFQPKWNSAVICRLNILGFHLLDGGILASSAG